MFIVSWNVAGWSATSKYIREDFGNLLSFLESTKADIVCLQEVKGTWAKLNSEPQEIGAADSGQPDIKGWESFWSLSSKAHRGFNGVATFVRKGLTWSCDSRPFDSENEDLNEEGRTVVTHHSACVIVNTYVVNARHGLRSELKMRFLANLKSLLERLKKETGKPVILLGDLNQTYRPQDAYWCFRRLSLIVMQQMICRAADSSDVDWEENFPFLPKSTLKYMEGYVAEQTALVLVSDDLPMSSVNTPSNRSSNGNFVNNDQKNSAEQRGTVKSISVDAGTIDKDILQSDPVAELIQRIKERQRLRQRQRDATSPLTTLAELCEAGIVDVCVDTLTRQSPKTHNKDLFALVQYSSLPPHADATVQYLKEAFLTELGLCDTLLHGRNPTEDDFCPCPYTCWDQSRNKRFTNEGTRVDYILIDPALVSHLVPCRGTPNNTLCAAASPASPDASGTAAQSFFSEFSGAGAAAGVRRATGGGLYEAASFDGSGLPALSRAARDVQFRGLPSTGLFVTPPKYSDHIGICALFEGIELAKREGKVTEKHACMYKPPVGLPFFFGKRMREEKSATEPSTVENAGVEQREKKEEDATKVEVIVVDDD